MRLLWDGEVVENRYIRRGRSDQIFFLHRNNIFQSSLDIYPIQQATIKNQISPQINHKIPIHQRPQITMHFTQAASAILATLALSSTVFAGVLKTTDSFCSSSAGCVWQNPASWPGVFECSCNLASPDGKSVYGYPLSLN